VVYISSPGGAGTVDSHSLRDYMCKAAYYHYIDGLSQIEVAHKLGLSRSTVCRLIKQAKEENILQISIRDPYARYLDLERRICQKYGIRDVIVAHLASDVGPSTIKTTIATEAAKYLQHVLKSGDIVGLSWGSTIYEVVSAMSRMTRWRVDSVHWVALHGSVSKIPYELDVHSLVRNVAWRFSGEEYIINVEGILDSPETVSSLLKESFIAEVLAMHDKVTYSLASIGSYYPQATSSLISSGYIKESELIELRNYNAVGDIALRIFDANGKECQTALSRRTVGITLEKYRNIPNKIVVAGGLEKVTAIEGALRGGLIDVLVTDPKAAERLSE